MKKTAQILIVASLLCALTYLFVKSQRSDQTSQIKITSRFVESDDGIIPIRTFEGNEQISIVSKFVETDEGIQVERSYSN